MTGWLIFYTISFSLLLLPRKTIPYIYPFVFFVFVGFRDNIGTDCPTTLDAVERSYMPLDNFLLNFEGFRALDLEFNHKLIAMVMSSLDLELRWFFVFLAGIEAVIIYYILKKVNNRRVFLLYFICLFSINYAMNTMRQGICFLFVVLAFTFEIKSFKHSKLWSVLSYFFGVASHYASSIIVAMCAFKIKKMATYVAIAVLLVLASIFVDFDMLDSRYGGAEGKYGLKGMGIRLFVFLGYYLFTSKKLVKENYFTQESMTLLMVMAMIPVIDAFVRLFNFYVYLLCFKNVIKLDYRMMSRNTMSTLAFFPLLALFLEFFEIVRTPVISSAGIWFPYSNWILEVL